MSPNGPDESVHYNTPELVKQRRLRMYRDERAKMEYFKQLIKRRHGECVFAKAIAKLTVIINRLEDES